MGVSTNAVLFYGYCWDEEGVSLLPRDDNDEELEWPEVIARRRGHVSPWDGYPHAEMSRLPYAEKRRAEGAWCAARRSALDAWYKVKRDVEEEFGVELDSHCSDDCPMPYLAAAGSVRLARRGRPEEVVPLEVDPQWAERLDRWFAEMGRGKPHPEPKWWLVSYYWG